MAHYEVTELFKVPLDIDLNDATKIESYDVKWNKLTIYHDGTSGNYPVQYTEFDVRIVKISQ